MQKPSVSIAIPAYNEEENIQSIILSLFRQYNRFFSLAEVTIYTDGSTDKTVALVESEQKRYPQLHLKRGKTNQGKLFRLNQIFAANTSDILIILDADIGLQGNNFLDSMVWELLHDKNVMLVNAHTVPIRPKNLIGKVVSSPFITWEYIRLSIPAYQSVHNLSGQATAYRGTFVKRLHIPDDATEERIYLYLMAKRENEHAFCYTTHAVMRYWPVSTFEDLKQMTSRSFGSKQRALDELFGFETESILIVPLRYKVLGITRALLREPLLVPTGLLLNFLLPRFVTGDKTKKTSRWVRSASTKRIIEL